MEEIKEFKNSFNIYDIFGYFLPGFFFISIGIIEYDLGDILNYYHTHEYSLKGLNKETFEFKINYLFSFLSWNTNNDFKFTTLFVLILFCYLLGHIIAAISSALIEARIVKIYLKFPSENLFDQSRRLGLQKIFKKFCRPFKPAFSENLEIIIKNRFGQTVTCDNYFWLCFSDISRYAPNAYNRILHFLNLYGFSRNVSMCFLLYVIIRVVILSFIIGSALNCFNWLIIVFYLGISLLMFKNYLKLYYRQCSELYYHFYSLHTKEIQSSQIHNPT